MPSTLLYLLRTGSIDPLLEPPRPEEERAVVLLHDAVGLENVPGSRVYALAEDAAERGLTPSAPAISYAELLEMVFDAERVVIL